MCSGTQQTKMLESGVEGGGRGKKGSDTGGVSRAQSQRGLGSHAEEV